MEKFALFRLVIESALGSPLEGQAPRELSGWEVAEALWPLNDIFGPRLEQIRSLQYDAAFEREADAAIERCVLNPWPPAWDDLPVGAWRVLHERHHQALVVAIANEQASNPLMAVPVGLAGHALTSAVIVFLMYEMRLPWPPKDRSSEELPGRPSSLRPH